MDGKWRPGGAALAVTGAFLTDSTDMFAGHGSTLACAGAAFGGAAEDPAGQGLTTLHGAIAGALYCQGW